LLQEKERWGSIGAAELELMKPNRQGRAKRKPLCGNPRKFKIEDVILCPGVQ
jgi:hypothetical protein